MHDRVAGMIRPYIYGGIALAIIAVGMALYFKGGSDNQRDADLNNANDYIEGTKDATDATTDLPDDDVGIIERLLRPWD